MAKYEMGSFGVFGVGARKRSRRSEVGNRKLKLPKGHATCDLGSRYVKEREAVLDIESKLNITKATCYVTLFRINYLSCNHCRNNGKIRDG